MVHSLVNMDEKDETQIHKRLQHLCRNMITEQQNRQKQNLIKFYA